MPRRRAVPVRPGGRAKAAGVPSSTAARQVPVPAPSARPSTGARRDGRKSPIGGFAHGATGIGRALARLSLSDAGSAAGRRGWAGLAESAFAYQESLYRPEHGDWLDVRIGERASSRAGFSPWTGPARGGPAVAEDRHGRRPSDGAKVPRTRPRC